MIISFLFPCYIAENMLILLSGMARFISLLYGTAICSQPLLLEGNHQRFRQSERIKGFLNQILGEPCFEPKEKQAARTMYCHEYILLKNEVLRCMTLSGKEVMMMHLLEPVMHTGELDRHYQHRSGGL